MYRNLSLYRAFAVVFVSIFAAISFGGCGADNVAACEDWVDSMDCGSTDFGSLANCQAYENTECDISDYFDCLTDNTECDEATGVTNTAGWMTCNGLATCD